MDKEKEYKRICEKLGFIPSEYKYDGPIAEDDTEIQGYVDGVFWERNSLSEQKSQFIIDTNCDNINY